MLGRNTYLIPPVFSRPSTADLDGVEILLHQHHQYLHHHHQPDDFSGLYLSANGPAEDAAEFNHESGDPAAAAPVRKQAAKKDRHSKIHTAQGPRDRRVRLSIGIARKFFDLQEMLGFDKPSKTLDWLLTKSKAAIKELVLTRASKSGSSPSACKMISSETGAESNRNKSGGKDKAGKDSLAKESRAKARARARERTLEKMCIKQLGGGDRCDGSDLNPSSFDQCRNNQLEFFQLSAGSGSSSSSLKSGGFRDPVSHLPLRSEAAAATQDLIEESIVIKRKNKNNPSVLGFQQNLVFSRDLNSNYMIPSANSNENWDVFGLTSQSNLHVAFDQHKFFHSNSNI